MSARRITSLLRIASALAGCLLIVFSLVALAGYHSAIHQPGQGGWSLHRLIEIAPQLLPYLLAGAATLALAILRLGKYAFAITFTIYLLSAGLILFAHLFGILSRGSAPLSSLLVISCILIPIAWFVSAILGTQTLAPSPGSE